MSNEASLAGPWVFFFFSTISIESVEGSLAWHKVCSLEPTELQDMTRLHV